MAEKLKKVVVVFFTYNEKDNIERSVEAVLEQEKNMPGHKIEIVISDSHSPDGTGAIAKKLSEKDPRVHYIDVGKGIGMGIIEGHLYSLKNLNPDIMVQLDADGQVEWDVLPRLVKAIDEGYDLAIGSRFVKGGENKLSFSRRLFTYGSSLICRVIMGPLNIREFTNSARAFTPELFKKINLKRLPWREQSFIIQPAFLNEAVLAGAEYVEVPLVFKNRAEGYSKNKVLNYIFDTFTYVLDARLHKMGVNVPMFHFFHKSKTFFKFGMVGLTGTIIDFTIYNLLIKFAHFSPGVAKIFSTETAIFNNFLLNNFWTFGHRNPATNIFQRFGIFNLVSLGGLGIAVGMIAALHAIYGNGYAYFGPLRIAYYNLYFLATIPPAMVWNFTANSFITWKHRKETKESAATI